MREIKFRAWAYASKVMFYPETDGDWDIIGGRITALPNTILMQYTGFKDKNGKEIYEGDVVKINPDDDDWNDIVIYHRGAFELKSYANALENRRACNVTMVKLWELSEGALKYPEAGGLEVIGNIYESPELING